MAAYRRLYGSRHPQADCKEPGTAPEPYARQSSMGYLYLYLLSCLAGCSGRGAEEGVVKAPPGGLRARRLQASGPGQAGRVVRIAENTRRQSSRRLPDEQFQPGRRTSVQVCTEGDVFTPHVVVTTNNVYYFWQPKATCTRERIKDLHTNTSNTANVIDDWL